MATPLAVAALSARMLAESARQGGYLPLALDLFGDADTRRAAAAWWGIGSAAQLAIDGKALLAALRRIANERAAVGWIAGSGFEGRPELLEAAAGVLPLIGNRPEAVARVRSPAHFFARLAALGIPHPETRIEAPAVPGGWLHKDAGGSGGWQVRPAAEAAEAHGAGIHYQRIAAGVPMSALFLADGCHARLLGVSAQIVRRLGSRPWVFRGALGPVVVPPAVRRELAAMVDALAADFALRGLNGLDFLLHGERIVVLELNPRPPASMAVHAGALAGGLVRAHWRASTNGRLPGEGELRPPHGRLSGFECVFAARRVRAGAATRAALERLAWCHDRPGGAVGFSPGEPLCTVSASAASVAELRRLLARRRRRIRFLMEKLDD